MFKIFLKLCDQNSTVLLPQVNRSWTIADLKRYIIAQHQGVELGNLRIIFSGRELTDELYIKDCDLDQNTTLFAVCKPPPSRAEEARQNCTRLEQSGSGYSSLHSQIEDLNSPQESTEASNSTCNSSLKPQLYVYCHSPCKSVQPGKLRVCCSLCKQGSFTVEKDPTCWEDVLVAGTIKGTCQTDGCHGNISEFYFKCGNHPTSEDERAVVLQHIKTNTRQVTCLTCADIRNPVLVFPCTDRHTICLECFHDYCFTQLNDRQFVQHDDLGYTLPCPSGCDHSFITEVHHFKILGEMQYDRYKQFAAEECLLRSGGVLCPTPGCGAGILPDEGRRVECVKQGQHGCGAVFCRNCQRDYHSGECHEERQQQQSHGSGYHVDSLRVDLARWERQQSEETIQLTTKPCPKCNTPTERNGGCMHMTCTRPQCKFDWCWVCGIEWNRRCMADHWFDVN